MRQGANTSDNIKSEFLVTLEEAKGIVTTACKNAGIARSTYYKWLSEDEDFKASVEEIQDVAIDYVEGQLFKKIEGVSIGKVNDEGELQVYDTPPSDTAIIFYLKTKGKKRGYVEKQMIEHSGGLQVNLIEGKTDPNDDPITG